MIQIKMHAGNALSAMEIMGILETGQADNININRQSRTLNGVLVKLVLLRVMNLPQCLFSCGSHWQQSDGRRSSRASQGEQRAQRSR